MVVYKLMMFALLAEHIFSTHSQTTIFLPNSCGGGISPSLVFSPRRRLNSLERHSNSHHSFSSFVSSIAQFVFRRPALSTIQPATIPQLRRSSPSVTSN